MCELYVVVFVAVSGKVAGTIAGRVWVFLMYYVLYLFCEIIGIPCFVQNRFPKPYRWAIAVSAYHVAYVAIHIVCELWLVVPKLPAGCVYNNKQAQFITGIHERRVLWIMCVSYYAQSCIAKFFCVTPMQTV